MQSEINSPSKNNLSSTRFLKPFGETKKQQYFNLSLLIAVLIHLAIFGITFFHWPWNNSKKELPPEIPIEIITESQKQPSPTETPPQPVIKRSGPDDSGLNAPKPSSSQASSEMAAPPPSSQPTTPTTPTVAKATPPTPPPQPEGVRPRQLQPMVIPRPRVIVPIPYPQNNLSQMMQAMAGIQRMLQAPQIGSGLGDLWLNAVKARIGNVDELLTVPGTSLPAFYIVTVDARGNILNVSVQKSCGIPSLDKAVIDHVRRVSTVPAPPPGTPTPIPLTLEVNRF